MIERDRDGTFTRAEIIAIGWVLLVIGVSIVSNWGVALITGGGILLLIGAGSYVVDREFVDDDQGPWSR